MNGGAYNINAQGENMQKRNYQSAENEDPRIRWESRIENNHIEKCIPKSLLRNQFKKTIRSRYGRSVDERRELRTMVVNQA